MCSSLFLVTLLLPSFFHFLTLLAVVPVRVLFNLSYFGTRSHVLFYGVAARKRGRIVRREPP